MKQFTEITDPIAMDVWSYKDAEGTIVSCRILVGRPEQETENPHKDWVCPVFIEHFTSRIVPAYGLGPVDALMNAMTLVKTFSDNHRHDLVDLGSMYK